MTHFNRDNNRAVWFDIPVANLSRACSFYGAVLAKKVEEMSFGDVKFGLIEHDQGNGGCLVVKPEEISSTHGLLLYLNVHDRIRDAVSKVASSGGSVVEDVHAIGPHGFRAIILDSEGNRLALHSENDC